ncbi:MAG TPA: VWA domain-containing protein [Nocardioides sp.]|nr:VWA domain-containing protein [Nocardioides sp.]
MTSGLLDTHIAFLEALRGAGVPVSLAEDLDAIAAFSVLDWGDREAIRQGYAATLVKRQAQRPTFDTLFDLYFPRLVGEGVGPSGSVDSGPGLERTRERLTAALVSGDHAELLRIATEAVGVFGAMPGRGPGLSSWSSYTALQRLAPQALVDRIVEALQAEGYAATDARRTADRRVGAFTSLVEADARRRIAEEKGADHVARIAVRPSLERLDFTSARRNDLAAMRREIYPLARRLASRMAREQRARRRGPLDFRRTVRASVGTGGVPLVTHHRPRRPHRTELVVLCDVSGSVASFAQFTLMLVYALHEQFGKVRAFTFVDQVHEVTDVFRPGADPGVVLAELAARTQHAAAWGRTNYGRAFTTFAAGHLDALGPRTSLLVLGDARSNYSDLAVEALREMTSLARHAWWLNPEHPRHWDTGDSAAGAYSGVVPMVECRNLAQLSDFVRSLA